MVQQTGGLVVGARTGTKERSPPERLRALRDHPCLGLAARSRPPIERRRRDH